LSGRPVRARLDRDHVEWLGSGLLMPPVGAAESGVAGGEVGGGVRRPAPVHRGRLAARVMRQQPRVQRSVRRRSHRPINSTISGQTQRLSVGNRNDGNGGCAALLRGPGVPALVAPLRLQSECGRRGRTALGRSKSRGFGLLKAVSTGQSFGKSIKKCTPPLLEITGHSKWTFILIVALSSHYLNLFASFLHRNVCTQRKDQNV
jgi:hypothetical protein